MKDRCAHSWGGCCRRQLCNVVRGRWHTSGGTPRWVCVIMSARTRNVNLIRSLTWSPSSNRSLDFTNSSYSMCSRINSQCWSSLYFTAMVIDRIFPGKIRQFFSKKPRLTLFGRSLILVISELLANAICWIVAGILFGRHDQKRSFLSLALLAWVRTAAAPFHRSCFVVSYCYTNSRLLDWDMASLSVLVLPTLN